MELLHNDTVTLSESRMALPFLCFIIFFVLVACPVMGQALHKKQLTREAYGKWSEMALGEISEDGNWISYTLSYAHADTLFVRNSTNGKTKAFASGIGSFFAKTKYVALSGNVLTLVDLKSGKEKTFSNVERFEKAETRLLVLIKNDDATVLNIFDKDGKLLYSKKQVLQFAVSTQKTNIAVSSGGRDGTVNVLTLSKSITEKNIATIPGGTIRKMFWAKDGSALGFIDKNTNGMQLYHYDYMAQKLRSFDNGQLHEYTQNSIVSFGAALADDGSRVFFYHQAMPVKDTMPEPIVQVWNAKDRYIYPKAKEINDWEDEVKFSCWEPLSNNYTAITDKKMPQCMVLPGQRFALVYNEGQYEPHAMQYPPFDLYLKNLETGEQKLLITHFDGVMPYLIASPNGEKLAIYKDNCWRIIAIESASTTIIQHPGFKQWDDQHDKPDGQNAFGFAGWTKDMNSLLLYDRFDIWECPTDGTAPKRLTHGAERGTEFKLLAQNDAQQTSMVQNIYAGGIFNLEMPLLLRASATDHRHNGYAIWSKDKGEVVLLWKGMRMDDAQFSKNGNHLFYVEQDYGTPQRIIKRQMGSAKEIITYQNNPHHSQFAWGKSELFDYTANGKSLQGILYYPTNHDPFKKYPMIVRIYERQSDQFLNYLNPTEMYGDGFNIPDYTSNGYFVLLPDIAYTVGKTGFSATACVLKAVDEVLKKNFVDERRIGLIGHSFGGYETDFIVGQTDRFAAAVAGAALTDNITNYLWYHRTNYRNNYYRIETFQSRMGKSLYEDYEGYAANSPVRHADKIVTPLLSWSGLEDYHLDYSQSVEFYMAMRRLGKEHVLLLYSGQGHNLTDDKANTDLSQRIREWFAHYLKDGDRPLWANAKN